MRPCGRQWRRRPPCVLVEALEQLLDVELAVVVEVVGPHASALSTFPLAWVSVGGPNPYDITADLLTWGAMTTAAGGLDVPTEGCVTGGVAEC